MNIHQELWQAFNDISFEETAHKYTDSLGTVYNSATGWIHKFSPDKDWDEISAKSAEKAGVSVEEIKAQWKRKGDYACNLGTQIHSVMENLWYKKDYHFDDRLSEEFPEMREDFEFRKRRCHELFRKMKRIYAPVANEFIVYDQPNGLCGTIDFLAYNIKTEQYAIIDWKTSKSFDTEGFKGECLKDPFGDIQACNTSEYSLQLSLYKYMLEKKTSIKISELLLFQIPGKEVMMPQVHRCFDLSGRIKQMLG